MTVFQDRAQFEGIMGSLFEKIRARPDIAGPLAATKMVVRFRYTEPEAVLTFDFTRDPMELRLDDEGGSSVEMSQTCDVSHQFWLGRLGAPRAIATGKVRARGNVPKALKLLPAIKPAFALYADVLRENGLGHLVAQQPARTLRRARGDGLWQRLWGKRRSARPELLPRDAVPPRTDEPPVAAPVAAPLPTEAVALHREMLRRMSLIREFEECIGREWAAGAIPTSAIHLSVGQEAAAVGVCFALRPSDCIASTHRGHGHLLAKGAPADQMMAEIYGKATGLCRGKGGSMHVTHAEIGGIGANGIVGASPLLAMGAALAFSHRGQDGVAVAFLGDGATNQGMFHEAVNMAAVWNLPALFVIENNQYAEFTSQARSTRVERLADRAAAYGIPGIQVDGNDVLAVYQATSRLVADLRAGKGPALLECLTYRWHGHMEGDEESYRSAAEVASWKERCPIARFGDWLGQEGGLSTDEVEAQQQAARIEIEAALHFAKGSPEPGPETLGTDIFAPEPVEVVQAGAAKRGTPPRMETITGSAAINLALCEEMARDDSVLLIGEDVSLGGYLAVTAGLVDRFGAERVRDTPISENAIVGGAVGAAMNGLRPVAEILFADFLTVCLDPLVNQAAKLRYMSGGQYRMPLVVRLPCGVGLGMAAQHSQSLEALLMGMPGLIIAAPGTPRDCRAMLKTAIRSDNPVLFFEHKLLYLAQGDVPLQEELAPFGKAAVLRPGGDITVVGCLYTVQLALEAAEVLAREGIEVEVIDPRTLAPLDGETILESVAKTGRLLTVEEGPVRHGWGAEVVARVAAAGFDLLTAAPQRLGGTDNPIPYNKNLENLSVPDVERIAARVRRML